MSGLLLNVNIRLSHVSRVFRYNETYTFETLILYSFHRELAQTAGGNSIAPYK